MLIFEKSRPGRFSPAQIPRQPVCNSLPVSMLRASPPTLPETSESQVVRHYTRLSQLNFCIDTGFYPLGSCTMKYNPRAAHKLAMLDGFLCRHPYAPETLSQGFLGCMHRLQEILAELTGMEGMSLAAMAGAQGEYVGVSMIRAYHEDRGDSLRREIIVPDAAHGTNPATASMCGCRVIEIATRADGDVDMAALENVLGPETAGIMLTNPSTLGVFERRIREIADLVHAAGGLLYYDGANLNAILGKVRPGDMGFDALHMNLHKTFATPHGAGGPGAGAVGVGARLLPYLPIPIVGRDGPAYRWLSRAERPKTIGRLSAFAGNAGVLLRAYVYARMLGRDGFCRVAQYATLNANYLARRLADAGFDLAFPKRRASHEFIVTLKCLAKDTGITALDVAKRLPDFGFHAPTIYFPMLIPECLLIEPTETESIETLDRFADAMAEIRREAYTDPEVIRTAPHSTPVTRLDETRAAKRPELVWRDTLGATV